MSVTKLKKSKPVEKKSSVWDRVRAVADVPRFSSALYYGLSGSGKTTLAATYPKPLLLLDLRETGTESISTTEGVDVYSVEKWKEFEEMYWELEKDKKYKTIVLDQCSALQSLGIDWIREDEGMEPDDIFAKRDWGRLSGLMQTWLLNYRNLQSHNKHIIFLAHERVFGEEEAEDQQMAPRVGARLSPSIESFLNGAVSVIGNTFIREKWVVNDPKKPGKKVRQIDYCLRIGPHGSFRTKIRKPLEGEPIPDVIVNPSYEKIERLSRGEGLVKKVRK